MSENYRNIYTFKGYYLEKEFLDLKKLIKDDRVISLGLDPMVAVMNDINVIDGYHNLYPLKYKKDFRNIIKNELEKNEKMRKYYDNWGSRVYIFTNNPKNPDIDYESIKKIGAKFLISRFELNKNKNLLRTCVECNTSLFLYEIL